MLNERELTFFYFYLKYLHKLNRQERVIEEVKVALKPDYKSKKINKEEYKAIMRQAVPKVSLICF